VPGLELLDNQSLCISTGWVEMSNGACTRSPGMHCSLIGPLLPYQFVYLEGFHQTMGDWHQDPEYLSWPKAVLIRLSHQILHGGLSENQILVNTTEDQNGRINPLFSCFTSAKVPNLDPIGYPNIVRPFDLHPNNKHGWLRHGWFLGFTWWEYRSTILTVAYLMAGISQGGL